MRIFIALSIWLIAIPAFAQQAVENEPAKKPLSIDEQISVRIQKLAREEMRKRMSFMEIVIDDISRLCELDDSQKASLILAAKGSSARSMDQWHEQAFRYFKTRVSGADIDAAQRILDNIGLNLGSRNADHEGELENLWTDSLKNILSEEQVTRYENVIEQRAKARVMAFAVMALAHLDDYLRLTPNQKEKLKPIVHQSANEYLDEIQLYWGDYLERNMLMSLTNAAEKETLTAILSDNQYGRLRTATSNLDHFWDQRRREKIRNVANQEKRLKPQIEMNPKPKVGAAIEVEEGEIIEIE